VRCADAVLVRLRILVFGLVAICGALLLVSRGGSADSGPLELKGRTTRGEPVSLGIEDGRVQSFDVQVGASCPKQRVWHGWRWSASGPFGGKGWYFRFRHRHTFPGGGSFVSEIRGRLMGDGTRARGTIETRGTWPEAGGKSDCLSSLAFEAAKAG
jgi:hypothetical protein